MGNIPSSASTSNLVCITFSWLSEFKEYEGGHVIFCSYADITLMAKFASLLQRFTTKQIPVRELLYHYWIRYICQQTKPKCYRISFRRCSIKLTDSVINLANNIIFPLFVTYLLQHFSQESIEEVCSHISCVWALAHCLNLSVHVKKRQMMPLHPAYKLASLVNIRVYQTNHM